MIRVSELRKRFGPTVAVDGISFTVKQGETFGLLGPNGSGKTTSITMIIGGLKPDSGSVTIGTDLAPADAQARRILGFSPQTLSLYSELTAQENLAFFARLYGLSGGRLGERVDWALNFSGLTDRRRDRVATFSGGMKRRLNLATALVHDPQVILMDEPTVGVDPQSRNHIFDNIEQLKDQGRTIIYTTHYMEEAQRLCDRVAIMDHGRILDMDSVSALIERHGGRSVIKAELVRAPRSPVALPGVLDGLSLRFESEQPLEDVGRLSSEGVAFQSLEVTRPDLETVFLTLTGRSLRD